MNNKEFVGALSQSLNLSPAEVQERINALNAAVVGMLGENDTLTLKSFGTFEVKKRLERVATNPATQQKMLVPPKLSLVFKPSSSLKDAINELQS